MLIEKQGLEPGVKAALRIVLELGQLAQQQEKDILHQVGRIRFLPAQTTRPVEQQWRIQLHETYPGGPVLGLAQTIQKSRRRRMHASPSVPNRSFLFYESLRRLNL